MLSTISVLDNLKSHEIFSSSILFTLDWSGVSCQVPCNFVQKIQRQRNSFLSSPNVIKFDPKLSKPVKKSGSIYKIRAASYLQGVYFA